MRSADRSRSRLRPTGIVLLSVAFVVSAVVLFALLYWLTDRYLIHQVDERLYGEVNEFHSISRNDAIAEISELARREVARSRPYGVFDLNGTWLAGNIRQLAHEHPGKPFDYATPAGEGEEHGHYYRGIIVPTTSGLYVVVGHSTDGIRQFDTTLIRTLCGGLALAILLATGFAAAMNALSNRRIREIAERAQTIMSGDLSRRLPTHGTRHDIDRLAAIVNSMLDEIEQLVAEVRGVCAGIAHDLRTPMTRLRAGLERARRRSELPADYELAIDAAINQADVVLGRFTALLRIAEVEAVERRGSFRDVRLDALLRDIFELYEPLAEGRGIDLRLETDEAVCVHGDVDLLFGAVENLLDNALKFTPAGGAVGLEARLGERGTHRLAVMDTGPGIAVGERDAVLRPFYRSVGQAISTEGHGLGLSLVAAVARVHGATLEIGDNRPGCRIELRFAGEV
ncbi:sensor histidine kinase [Trinickia dinghuensis]|uniref:histidine kinase n=1 Tax=Trinickia dinghuensis TaxID=2291023 RepID=A0A3D8JQ42_9BURK|nr:ATP-binding protein [Trinickia dinghuensis]RDU94826.1 HAMP domain-containing protein [Trinickia dinghuensis]